MTINSQLNSDDTNHHQNDTDDSKISPKLFFTTSDLLHRINSVIEQSNRPIISTSTNNHQHIDDDNKDDNLVENQHLVNNTPCSKFELQKQLPNGSLVPCSSEDYALADFQSKMKQTAAFLSHLTPSEKLEWAIQQRQNGNQLFANSDYKEAMDVYLTCLLAIDTSNTDITSNKIHNQHEPNLSNNNDTEWKQRTETEIQLPVLLNLAACSLALKMYKKTIQFCNFASEIESSKQNPKLFFRRGKAYMLIGEYTKAKHDLDHALKLVSSSSSCSTISNDEQQRQKEISSIQKEMIKLEHLVEQGKRNRDRQEKAMKKLLLGQNNQNSFELIDDENISGKPADYKNLHQVQHSNNSDRNRQDKVESTSHEQNREIHESSLINDSVQNDGLYSDVVQSRSYSKLRAKPRKNIQKKQNQLNESSHDQSTDDDCHSFKKYWIWYLGMFEYNLRKALVWLGDEDAMNRNYNENEFKQSKVKES